MPLSRMTVKRAREMELRQSLRILRTAIDDFRRDCAPAGATATTTKLSQDYCKTDQNYYPEPEQLTEPLKLAGAVDKTKNICAGSRGIP